MTALALPLAAAVVAAGIAAPAPPDRADDWSASTRGLQGRVTLARKPAIDGPPVLVPYLELRNAGDSAYPLKVRCGHGHVTFELVDAAGKVVRDGHSLPRSGPHPDPGTVSLPLDSSIRIGMYCSNWGVSRNAAAVIPTDSGAWELTPGENGKVFLRATVSGSPVAADPDRTWHGSLVLPAVKVVWDK